MDNQNARLRFGAVEVECRPPINAAAKVANAAPDSLAQSATILDSNNPQRSFSLTAIPFGSANPIEGLPPARRGGISLYRKLLQAFRRGQGAMPEVDSYIHLFGKRVKGASSQVPLVSYNDIRKTLLVTEWVVEAGSALWIARMSEVVEDVQMGDVEIEEIRREYFSGAFADCFVESTSLDQPLTLLDQSLMIAKGMTPSISPLATLTVAEAEPEVFGPPAWWDGVCNQGNYRAAKYLVQD